MKGLSKGRYDETFADEDDPLADRRETWSQQNEYACRREYRRRCLTGSCYGFAEVLN